MIRTGGRSWCRVRPVASGGQPRGAADVVGLGADRIDAAEHHIVDDLRVDAGALTIAAMTWAPRSAGVPWRVSCYVCRPGCGRRRRCRPGVVMVVSFVDVGGCAESRPSPDPS